MRRLKILLGINGLVFLLRAFLNITRPTSFYLEPDAPKYAVDTVRVLGISYSTLGFIQLGTWWMTDRRAVRIVAAASALFAAGVGTQAATQGSGSTDLYHRIRFGAAAEHALVAAAYIILLRWESQTASTYR